MNKKTFIKCSEQDITELLQERFGEKYDSIVAAEEIGNQEWIVDVSPADLYDHAEAERSKEGYRPYCTNHQMNVLCAEGVLEEGEYIVDCTW